jgi:hypothetical protein
LVAPASFPPRDPLPHIATVHRPAFTATFVATADCVDATKAFRALLKTALRRFRLRAIAVREHHAHNPPDEPQTGRLPMSAFSERVRSQRDKGLFKVADFDGNKELTLTVDHLDEQILMFDKEVDLLNFVETGRQLQLNQTTSEWLIDNLGENPETWPNKKVTLYLGEYEYNRETKRGIRLKLPGQSSATNGPPPPKALPPRREDLDDEIPPF